MTLEIAATTDIGRRRETNQDAVYAAASDDGRGALLIVADGMGGHAAGEVASRLALDAFRHVAEERLLATPPPPSAEIDVILAEAVAAANRAVHADGQAHPERQGMGTTLLVALLSGDQAWLSNVGDSRAYRIQEGRIARLTIDHNLVEEAVRAGELTREAAARHPLRNVLTRAIGTASDVAPDLVGPLTLEPDDTLLLCSDGLHGVVLDEEIAALAAGRPPAEAAKELLSAANVRGGPDNIALALARYRDA